VVCSYKAFFTGLKLIPIRKLTVFLSTVSILFPWDFCLDFELQSEKVFVFKQQKTSKHVDFSKIFIEFCMGSREGKGKVDDPH